MRTFSHTFLAAFIVLLSPFVWAGDFQKGWAAYNSTDYATALSEWQELADAGDTDACYGMGLLYGNGFGVDMNDDLALKYYGVAAAQGHAEAQYSLGVMYQNGWGVPMDEEEGIKWYLLAADQEIEKLRLLLGEGKVTADDVSSAVANSSRYDVFKLVDAALIGDAKRSLKILAGLRAEGIEPVIVVWSLTRELRVLANLADAIAQGMDLASGMRKARIWNNRQSLVRSCVARHQPGDFHKLLKATNHADRAAKGQTYADPWQVATEIVLGLSLGRRKAA